MFKRLVRRVRTELIHYYSLNSRVRRLFISYSFFLAAYPCVVIFLQAYLWRTSHNLWWNIIYNVFYMAGLPVGFYINTWLLRRFPIVKLYFAGSLFQGVSAFCIVFLAISNIWQIGLFGLIFGVGSGLYWANKNFLSLLLTKGTNRLYYMSLEQIVDLLVNIIIPAASGWFIVYGEKSGYFTSDLAYRTIMLVGLSFLLASGLLALPMGNLTVKITSPFIKKSSHPWNVMRAFNIFYNIQVGLNMVIQTILVLILVGGEDVLGFLQTLTALISAGAIYAIGRKSHIRNSWKYVSLGVAVLIAGTIVLASSFNWIGAIAYTIAMTICWVMVWPTSFAVSMEIMDKEAGAEERKYAYICDTELFFNIGRIIGAGIISSVIVVMSQNIALRYVPVVIAVSQIVIIWPIKFLAENIKSITKPIVIAPENTADDLL